MTKTDVAFERKNQIVRATVDCITRFGYHNFSMQDVAKSAGVSKGIIHYYFLNKDDLMLSVLEKVVKDIGSVLHTNIETIADPVEKLKILIELCADIVKSTKEYYQVSMDFWTLINQKESVRKIISEHYQSFRSTFTKVLEEGIKQECFKKVNPEEYSIFILATIDGISLQWLFDKQTFDYDGLIQQTSGWLLNNIIATKD